MVDGFHLIRRYLFFAQRTCIVVMRRTRTAEEPRIIGHKQGAKVKLAEGEHGKWGKIQTER